MIAFRHADIGQGPVCDKYRLRTLQMRIARHHRISGRLSNYEKRIDPLLETVESYVNALAHKQAHVSRDLLVAAAAGVKLQRQATYLAGEFQLDVVMDILRLWCAGHNGSADLLRTRRIIGLTGSCRDTMRPVGRPLPDSN